MPTALPVSLVTFSNIVLSLILSLSLFVTPSTAIWDVPATGYTTITHYTQPLGYVGACGCTGAATEYRERSMVLFRHADFKFLSTCFPLATAALSSLAFGSTQNYGPGCGACYKLTPVNSFQRLAGIAMIDWAMPSLTHSCQHPLSTPRKLVPS